MSTDPKTGYWIILLLIFFNIGNGLGQTRSDTINIQRDISGVVWEIPHHDSTGIAVPDANVLLLHAKDSSMVKGVSSDPHGEFLFSNIHQGDYILSVSYMGYATSCIQITSGRFRVDKVIELGKIILEESEVKLDSVVVAGQIPDLVIRGDTLEYNPAAFKTQEGAVVEDLLKQLPGIEVDHNGKITTFAGKEIRRVYVNGKEFFGDDPKMATKNLTVDILDKVQVIEKKTEQAIQTGVDDGEKETVINLTVKKNRMKGWMGNGTVSGGTLVDNRNDEAPRYNVQGNLMKFTDSLQTGIIANANNIMSGGRGITNTNSFGYNISKDVNEKLKMSGDMSYHYSDNFSTNNSFRTNLMADSVSYRKSSSENQSASRNIGFNARIEYKPDTLYTIFFSPHISFNSADMQYNTFEETLAGDLDSMLINRRNSNSSTNSNGVTMNGSLTITRLFSRKGRRLSLSLDGHLYRNSDNGLNESFNDFFLQPEKTMNLNQESASTSNTGSYNLRFSYIEPLKENMNLSFFYDYRSNKTQNLRETFDFNDIDGAYSLLNTDYSRSTENQNNSQNISVNLNATNPKLNYNLGLNIMPSSTQSVTFIKNGDMEGQDSILNRLEAYKVVNYSPQVNFFYIFNRQTNLNLTYRGNTMSPSAGQLDPTPNIANPMSISTGNPDLLPSFTNSISLRFNTNRSEKQRSLFTSFDYNFTLNEIIYYTDYEPGTGIQHTAPINENGSWNASGNVMFNTPVDSAKRLRVSLMSRLSYNNRIGYTTVERQSYRNVSGTTSLTGNVGLNYSKDRFFGSLQANAGFFNTNNTYKGGQNQQNVNYNLSYNTQIPLLWKIDFNSDINYRIQRGLTAGYNTDEIIWNIGLSKPCLKNNTGTLKFVWNDILQQRSNINRSITAYYIEDSQFTSLTSYVLCSFAYRFNAIGGKK